eukprot:m.337249 g.337249  ORF g.337249 m.337249 type:complete len:61 (+) comp18084_c0_seq1:1494-1676(+)
MRSSRCVVFSLNDSIYLCITIYGSCMLYCQFVILVIATTTTSLTDNFISSFGKFKKDGTS